MRVRAWGLCVLMLVLAACGGSAPAQSGSSGSTIGTETQSGASTTDTAAGYGVNATGTVADLSQVFASVQQASQLQLTANATPPGATGPDVQSISIVAQDKGGVLKGLDAAGKQSLGNALLSAAAAAWPNAEISLLVSDPAGAGGTIIGQHPKGGQSTVIAS
jgi:hypothetical protein